MVEEIRLHGTGGQGVVAAGELLAIAASYEGRFCRAFPMYGSARRGAPVVAFAQIGDESEATRSMIYYPKYLIILDPPMPLTVDVTSGLVKEGVILYNTPQSPEEAVKVFKVEISKIGVVDANAIAEKTIGRPIPNTVMLGVFAKATGVLRLESVEKAVLKRFEGEVARRNIEAVRAGYGQVRIKTFGA